MATASAASSAADAAKRNKLFSGATAQVGVEPSANLRMPRPLAAPFAVSGITATKEDAFNDSNNDGKAKPGDTISYTVVITNNAATDAANVVFSDTIDAQTTLVNGSIQTTPVARTDTYAVTGNIQRSITATNEGVLNNDIDPDGTGTLSVTSTGAQTTAQGGNLTLNADGTFTYNPPAGFDGTDTFNYTITDGTGSGTGKMVFNISGMFWFIDNSQATNGDGRLTNPFNNLASFASINDGAGNHPAANDNIFLYRQSASDYTGGTPLLNGQKLIGQGATASLSTITGITPPPGSLPLPATGGTNPVIVNGAGNDVTIVAGSAGNTIRGVSFGNASGSAIASGAGFGTLNVSDSSISTTGQALNLNTGTLAATFATLASSGGANNIKLTSVNTGLTVSNGNLSGSTGTALDASNGATGVMNITYPGNITNTNGQTAIKISNAGGGTLTIGGTVTVSGGVAGNTNDGIVIDGNDTAAYTVGINVASINTSSMDDGLVLRDLPGSSSVTISSGSITSQGAGRRTIDFESENTAGTYNFSAVDFNNNNGDGFSFGSGQSGTYSFRDYTVNNPNGGTGINVSGGSPAITFRRIDQNGGTNGINVSNNTTGSFTVNGTGTTDGSGGTIQNVTAKGASFATANNVTLKNMNFSSTGTTDADPAACGADNVGNTNCNGAIHLATVTGVTLDNIDTNGGQYGVNGNNVTTFSLANANILNHGNGANEHGIRFINLKGTSSINSVAVSGSFTDNLRVYNTAGTVTLTLKNSSFNNTNGTSGNAGVNLITDTTANMTVNVQGSTFDNNRTVGLLGTFQGTSIANITVTTNPDNASDRSLFNSNNEGIDLGAQGSADLTFNINNSDFLFNDAQAMNLLTGADSTSTCDVNGTVANNVIGNATALSGSTTGQGIRLDYRGNSDAALTITNNNIQHTHQQGIQALSRLSVAGCAAGNCGTLALTVTGNTVGTPDNSPNAASNVNGMTFTAEDARSICLDIENNTSSGNTNTATGYGIRTRQADSAVFQLEDFTGTGTSATSVEDFLDSPRNNATADVQTSGTGTLVNYTGSSGCANSVATSPSSMLQTSTREFYAQNAQEAPEKVAPAASVAETRTASTSSKASDEAKTTARSIADVIARASRRTEQPTEEVELASAGVAASNFAAAVRLAPEVAGITDAGTGRRRSSNVKAREQKALATTSAALFSGETVTRNIGTLPAGASVTITFQVTVNDPFTGATDQVSNQGSVTSSFPTVQTQNKEGNTVSGGATITQIEAPPDITINPATAVEPQSGSSDAVFTVSLSRTATSTITVNYQTEDGTATIADGDYSPTSGTLTFTNGQRVQSISVPVLANTSTTEPEPDETFKVKLTGTAGGRIKPSPDDAATGTITATATPAPVVISEFRSAGPNGAEDEFIELYNNTNAVSVDISGWSIVQLAPGNCAATPVIIATIPANTILQPRKHYLLVGSGYAAGTLNSYAAPEPGAPTLSPSLDDGASIGLFKTATIEGLTSDNRVDAVGFISNSSQNNCDLLREGSALDSPVGSGSNSDYSFMRMPSDKLQDTNQNRNDFIIVSTTPTTPVGSNPTPIQGSPGPENTSSPTWKSLTEMDSALIAPNVSQANSPNRHIVRVPYDDTITPSGPTGVGSQYAATMSVQRRYFNNTGQTVTRLRIRVVDMTTTNVPNIYAPSSQVDLRLLSSDGATRAPAGFPNLKGLTLDRAANQPRGGGINSSATAMTVNVSPLATADDPNTPNVIENAVDLQMLLGYTGSGKFRFFIMVEALP
jgi:hypothetical protein